MVEKNERLIARYLNGDCNSDEINQLLGWINQSKTNKKLFLGIKDTWDGSLQKTDNSDKALLSFYKNQANKNNRVSKSIRLWRMATGIAAVLFVGLLFAVLLNKTDIPESNIITYSVPLGSRSEVVLADGTHVNLNSGSTLYYPSNFSSHNRNVSLSGEAFFNVTSDKTNPFVVKTADFDINVTGTQFNVCSYDDNNYSTATLLEGEINLSAPNLKPLVLKPGEKIKLDRLNNKIAYATYNEDAEVAWKNGEFIFSKIAFPELIKRLERWYNVQLNYSSSEFDMLTYSGRFKNQETIWQVLDALKLTSPIDYSRTNFREFELKFMQVNN